MNFQTRFKLAAVFLLLVLWLTGFASAQQTPRLAYVYPAGGKPGTTFQITVGGQFLQTASNAFFSSHGIQATVLEHHRPMGQKEFNELRDRLKILQDKFQASRKGNPGTNIWMATDAKERDEIRAKILRNPPNRKANPSMQDTVILRITIAADAPPGDREIRLTTPNALSNPLKFCLGELPEVSKLAAKPENPELAKYFEKIGGQPAPVGTPKYEARVKLPATINGQIMPGGVDRYRFSAVRGQQLVIAASARALIPYLADAVPGWFEPVLTVADAQGRELASEERFRFRPDPVIHFTVPRDGEYTVAIHDSIYRGREDFVYRLAIGELPFVTGIYPLGGRAGEKTTVTLTGWNLPEKTITVDNAAATPGVVPLAGKPFNPIAFAVDTLPEAAEHELANAKETAQAVTLPVIINGRISSPGQPDVFKFTGQAGQKIVAEVYARRLDSPLDSHLQLTDAAGQPLAFNDDFEDKGSGLNTHHADAYLTATLPADGMYFIHLTDTQAQGGPEFAYRLRISAPQPDFALRVVPSSLSLRAGLSLPVTVFALRRDGFTNAIDLQLKDAPAGFSLSGARMAANQDKLQFTLKAPAQPMGKPVPLTIEGRATLDGKPLVHEALPAEDMMQAFLYRHLVPSKELAVVVNGAQRLFQRDAFKIISPTPVTIQPGGTVKIRVSAPPAFADRFKLELDNAPEGISLASVSPVTGGLELAVSCDSETMKPGFTGNLICDVVQKNQGAGEKKKPGNQPRRTALATLPAIPFQIAAE